MLWVTLIRHLQSCRKSHPGEDKSVHKLMLLLGTWTSDTGQVLSLFWNSLTRTPLSPCSSSDPWNRDVPQGSVFQFLDLCIFLSVKFSSHLKLSLAEMISQSSQPPPLIQSSFPADYKTSLSRCHARNSDPPAAAGPSASSFSNPVYLYFLLSEDEPRYLLHNPPLSPQTSTRDSAPRVSLCHPDIFISSSTDKTGPQAPNIQLIV